MLPRSGIQFHWSNRPDAGYHDFDDFLMSLNQVQRKKIRQERRKVSDAGIRFRCSLGERISDTDWDFSINATSAPTRTWSCPLSDTRFFQAHATHHAGKLAAVYC